ncbi:hypothetical protein NL676_034715 [Syzygium grande]|nr:hypothetical protein NL676_034715 [Syzygium grande]
MDTKIGHPGSSAAVGAPDATMGRPRRHQASSPTRAELAQIWASSSKSSARPPPIPPHRHHPIDLISLPFSVCGRFETAACRSVGLAAMARAKLARHGEGRGLPWWRDLSSPISGEL